MRMPRRAHGAGSSPTKSRSRASPAASGWDARSATAEAVVVLGDEDDVARAGAREQIGPGVQIAAAGSRP